MNSREELQQWNAIFGLVAGKVICSTCLREQEVMDAEEAFLHRDGCVHKESDLTRPWAVLHSILDSARG